MPISENPIFIEKQYFRKWWLIALLGALNLLIVYAIISQVFLGLPFGDNPMSDVGLFIVLILMGAFTYFFFTISLKLEVLRTGLQVTYFPFFKNRFIAFKEIEEAAIRQYKPLIEYGGWGLRGNFNGIAYTISGNHGLQMKLKDGRRLLIGTQKPEELAKAIQSVM